MPFLKLLKNLFKLEEVAEKVTEIVPDTIKNIITAPQQKETKANERLKIDNLSDNFLSKNIRPFTTLVLLLMFVYVMISPEHFTSENKQLIIYTFEITIAFYFNGRTFEKIFRKWK